MNAVQVHLQGSARPPFRGGLRTALLRGHPARLRERSRRSCASATLLSVADPRRMLIKQQVRNGESYNCAPYWPVAGVAVLEMGL